MSGLLRVRSRRGAYALLVALTVVWGLNWVAMKLARSPLPDLGQDPQVVIVLGERGQGRRATARAACC